MTTAAPVLAFDLHSAFLWAVLGSFLLAGFVKGVVGLGLPTIAMGLLGAFLLPAQAAVLLLLPSLVTNLWQMLAGPHLAKVTRELWTLQAAALLATLFAPVSLSTLNPHHVCAGLGVALMAYAAFGLWVKGLSVPPRWRPWATPLVGLLTGAVTAATGVFAFPAVPYMQALGLKKEELVQALGLSFTASTVALWGRLALDGAWRFDGMAWSLPLAIPLVAALAGMALGQWLRGRLSEAAFKRVFFIGMLLLGSYLLAKGLTA
jgi:uncharacterized membrane protein YfcA